MASFIGNKPVRLILSFVAGYLIIIPIISYYTGKINADLNQLRNVIDVACHIEGREKTLDDILDEYDNHVPHID